MTEPSTPSPDTIFEWFTAYQRTAAITAAVELDVFAAVGEGNETIPALAQRCGAAERGMRPLLDYLVVNGFLAKTDERYRLTDLSATFLDPRSPQCMASALRFLTSPGIRGCYEALTDAVRQGATAAGEGGTTSPENPVWVEFARGMEPVARGNARGMADLVLARCPNPTRVLDVAAGHGRYGIEFAERCADAHVHALDWRNVLEVATENAAASGVSERHHLIPGSAMEVDWGEGYDVVLLTNFIHHFDATTCVSVLEKARNALRDGGVLATLEAVTDEDRISPPAPAAFSLVMLATTPGGDAYTESEYREMHRKAGFADVTLHEIPPSPHQVLIAVK